LGSIKNDTIFDMEELKSTTKEEIPLDMYKIPGQSADIKVNPGTYKLINDNIKTNNAVLFFWENGIARENVWHTNFFAVKNLQYLPPVNTPMDSDVLETKYGKYLLNNKKFQQYF
jgi:hypothetical protein